MYYCHVRFLDVPYLLIERKCRGEIKALVVLSQHRQHPTRHNHTHHVVVVVVVVVTCSGARKGEKSSKKFYLNKNRSTNTVLLESRYRFFSRL